MPSVYDADLLALVRSGRFDGTLLVEVALTHPSARTVRLSFTSVSPDPSGGVHFHGALSDNVGAVDNLSAFLPSSMPRASWSFAVLDVWLPGQASDETAAKLFSAYRWKGATVSAWLWAQGLAYSKRGQVFRGTIEDYRSALGEIVVECVQDADWNREIVPEFVDTAKYPRAPEKSIGAPIPYVLGRGRAQGLRGPFARVLGTDRNNFDHNGGAIPTLQGVLVDTGRGGGAANPKAKVVVASNALSNIGSGSNGSNFFGKTVGDVPNVINPDVADIFNSAALGAGFYVPDEAGTYWLPIFCSEIVSVATPADNPRAILDPGREITFAKLDNDAANYYLWGALPDVEPPGTMLEVWVFCGYSSGAGVGDLRIRFERLTVGDQLWTPTAGVNRVDAFGPVNTIYYDGDWRFSRNRLRVEFLTPGGGLNAGVKLKVRTLGIAVRYRPKQQAVKVVKGWRILNDPMLFSYADYTEDTAPDPGAGLLGIQTRVRVEVPTSELLGEFFANGDGPNDDGFGTDTGTAGALICRAPDLARYLLKNRGGVSASDIETGSGVHGSFNDARADLKTWNKRDIEHLVAVSSPQPVAEVLEVLARDSCSAVFVSRQSGKFKWVPFVRSPALNYDLKIEPEHVLGDELLRFESMPSARLVTAVRVAYLWDAFRREFAGEVSASPSYSTGGYSWMGIRDQLLTVTAGANDKLDWRAGSPGVVYTATLTAGSYEPWDFAKMVAARMMVAAPAEDCIVHYGPRVETGYNDALEFWDGANRTAAIPQGDYASMEDLAVAVAAAMNAVSTNWTCTYSRTTKRFTIDRTAGAKWLRLGALAAQSVKGALGFLDLATVACPATSEHEVEEERFVVTDATARLELLIETGTNGLNGTRQGCWPLLGFQGTRNTEPPSSNSTSAVGDCPKGNREALLDSIASAYRVRRDFTLQARTLLDTDAAREIRNRYIDLGAAPRAIVSFRSLMVPDLELFQRLEFSSRFDSLVPYTEFGSDGSWAGKSFWVVGTRQHVRPRRWETEVVCVRA